MFFSQEFLSNFTRFTTPRYSEWQVRSALCALLQKKEKKKKEKKKKSTFHYGNTPIQKY